MRFRAGVLALFVCSSAIPSFAYRMSAWVPAWDVRAVTSMQLNAGKLDETNPVWYEIAAGGTFTKAFNAEAADLRAALTGTDIVPTIQNYVNGGFDGNLVATIVASPTLREQHAEALTQLVVQNAYAGIDIDYENMSSAARAGYSTFIQLLASKLHSANKTLSVCVDAKTSDADNWNGPAAEDWRVLGAAADSIKIMAYDDHWSTSPPGPIAPLDWLDAIATYAEATIPAQKIVIGLPWYGYDWAGGSGTGVVYQDAMALAQSMNAPVAYDGNGEATFSYSGHTVYFQNATSYARKTSALIAKHPRIGGFAQWRAGGEDPAMWTTVAELRGGSSSPSQPPAGSFVVTGAAALTVNAGQQLQSAFAITPVNGWSGTAAVSVQQIDAFPGTVSISPSATTTNPAVLTIVASANAAPGNYRLKLAMTSGAIASNANVTVTIQPPPPTKRRAVKGSHL